MNIDREMVAAYGADVVSVQQLWKWCCDFENGQVSVTMRTEGAIHQQTNMFIINKMVQAERHVSIKQSADIYPV